MEYTALEKRTHFLWILLRASAIMKKDSVIVCTACFARKGRGQQMKKSNGEDTKQTRKSD